MGRDIRWVATVAAILLGLTYPDAQSNVPNPVLLTDNGGRLSWYHGSAHELIAFDAITGERQNTELYLMNSDGSGRRCVTCDAGLRKGFVGQPSWHPDGEHIVIQVENDNSPHRLFNHMSWGVDNDLWLIRRDGSGAERIWETQKTAPPCIRISARTAGP